MNVYVWLNQKVSYKVIAIAVRYWLDLLDCKRYSLSAVLPGTMVAGSPLVGRLAKRQFGVGGSSNFVISLGWPFPSPHKATIRFT